MSDEMIINTSVKAKFFPKIYISVKMIWKHFDFFFI